MSNLPASFPLATDLCKRLSRVACSMVWLLAFAAPLPAVDMLYVTLGDNTIVTYDTTGNVGTTIAATKAVFANTNLNVPYGLAFDSSGNLYAANVVDNTISKFNSAGTYLSNITGNLNRPVGLAFDSSGNLYAANVGDNTISKFNASGAYLSNITGNLNSPVGLAFDSSGNLYAANIFNDTISKFNASGAYVSNITGNLNSPIGLAFDTSGNLYAANNYNSTISKFDASGTFLTSWNTGAGNPLMLAFKPVTVPEPSTYALAAIATGVMAFVARRRKARGV